MSNRTVLADVKEEKDRIVADITSALATVGDTANEAKGVLKHMNLVKDFIGAAVIISTLSLLGIFITLAVVGGIALNKPPQGR